MTTQITRQDTDPRTGHKGADPDVVIVGAGQTGLSTAYYLGRAGVDCMLLDEHPRVGDQWRRRYESLVLNTPAKYDGLPGMRFPAPRNAFPTGRQMGDYLERYAETMGITVRTGTRVARIDRQADGWYRVTTSTGLTFRAHTVVIAQGGEQTARVPDFAGQLDPGIRQLHSSEYHRVTQLLPGPVLVVGTGQSGADLALEAVRAGHETILSGTAPGEIPVEIDSRRAQVALPLLWFAWNHLLTTRTPVGRRLQPKIRMGGAPLLRVKRAHLDAAGVRRVDARTDGARDGRPMLADGQVLDVANVLWCTGFRSDFSYLRPPVADPGGWPRDRGGVVPESPGLFFVGLIFQRGFYSMLIGGARRDAAYIAQRVVARARMVTAA